MADTLPSAIDLSEEKDQAFLLQELIREMAKIQHLLRLRLGNPTERAAE